MTVTRPHFLNDDEWYYYDEEVKIYKLTERATKKAKESYDEFYKTINDEEEELK